MFRVYQTPWEIDKTLNLNMSRLLHPLKLKICNQTNNIFLFVSDSIQLAVCISIIWETIPSSRRVAFRSRFSVPRSSVTSCSGPSGTASVCYAFLGNHPVKSRVCRVHPIDIHRDSLFPRTQSRRGKSIQNTIAVRNL